MVTLLARPGLLQSTTLVTAAVFAVGIVEDWQFLQMAAGLASLLLVAVMVYAVFLESIVRRF